MSLVTSSSELALWHSLIGEAQHKLHRYFPEEIESYLVFLLLRNTTMTNLTLSIALEYLHAQNKPDALQKIGDRCLLLCSFYPEYTNRRTLSETDYIEVGRSAYYSVHNALFDTLSQEFIKLKEVLRAVLPHPQGQLLNFELPTLSTMQQH